LQVQGASDNPAGHYFAVMRGTYNPLLQSRT